MLLPMAASFLEDLAERGTRLPYSRDQTARAKRPLSLKGIGPRPPLKRGVETPNYWLFFRKAIAASARDFRQPIGVGRQSLNRRGIVSRLAHQQGCLSPRRSWIGRNDEKPGALSGFDRRACTARRARPF